MLKNDVHAACVCPGAGRPALSLELRPLGGVGGDVVDVGLLWQVRYPRRPAPIRIVESKQTDRHR